LYNIIDLNDQRTLRVNGFLTRNSLCKERRSLNYTMPDLICFKLNKSYLIL